MKAINKSVDIIVNVLVPLVIGIVIYIAKPAYLLRNYLPDGLWAYAFTSCLLIIWSRQINIIWMGVLTLSFVLFEYGQFIKLIPGTADIADVLVYLVFGAIALVSNKLYNPKIN